MNLNLGVTEKEAYGFPEGPLSITSPAKEEKIIYPAFTYSGPDELELPDSGEMTIEFKKVSETSSVKDGKHHYECRIEVHKILDVESDEPESPTHGYNDAEDALDALAKKLVEAKESDE